MSKDDWYRNTKWNKTIKNEFMNKLDKSRSIYHKSQYLRIQASYLSKKYYKDAKELLNLLLEKYYDESQLASTYLQLAEIEKRFSNVNGVLENYRKSIEQQRIKPNILTNVHKEFSLYVIEKKLTKYYNEVLNILEEFSKINSFPIDFYESFGCISIINYLLGNKTIANEYAIKALDYSNKIDSGFRYHKKLGLVQDFKTKFHKQIVKISKEVRDKYILRKTVV